MKTGKASKALMILCSFLYPFIGAGSAFAAPAKKVLSVGIVLRLEDKFNDTVAAMITGIEAAKALYEKKHPRVKINLKRYPHGDDLESVASASQRVIHDKIPAVIGGELSEESFVLRDRLGEAKTIFITPTSSNPAVTEDHPFSFRACFSDRLVAGQLANFMIDNLKPVRVGVLHNVSSPYTDFLSKQFLETYNARMEKLEPSKRAPIFEEKVLRDTKDFSEQIQRFMDAKVTHLSMMTHQSDLLRFALQAANKGFFPVYIGSDGWGSNEHVYKNLVQESPLGDKFKAYRNSYWKEDANTPMARDFQATYATQNSRKPTAWSAVSFDAAWILFTAMDHASNPKDGEAIRKQMAAIKNIPLVTAERFSFGPDNSPRKDLYIYKLDKTGINYEATLR